MAPFFLARQDPAGREPRPSDQSLPNDTSFSDAEPRDVLPVDGAPKTSNDPDPIAVPRQEPNNRDQQLALGPLGGDPPPNSGSPNSGTQAGVPDSPLQPGSGSSDPSLATNGHTTTPTPANQPAPSPNTTSTSNLSVSSTLSTHPTPTALLEGGASSSGSPDQLKYIIGGSVGGGVLVLILLALLLLCCHKRRAKRDPEHTGGRHEGHTGHGQFNCCNAQTPMGPKSPLRPFILKSPAALTTKERQRQQPVTVSLNRRDSTGSQKSSESDTCESDYSTDGSSRRRRGPHKRPPPLKLTSLVTPVINGPQHNPRDKTLQNPHEIPTIVVESPRSRSRSPERVKRH